MAIRAHVLRRAAAILASVATLTASAGCSLLPGSGDGENPQMERNTLRVGYLQVVDVAPLQIAKEQGLFERAGLTVDLVDESSEVEGINQLDTTLDVVWASHVNLFLAIGTGGKELQIQGEAYQAGSNTMALVAAPNSPYNGPSDDTSPRIAVPDDQDVGMLTTKAVLSTAGVEKNRITATEMPFEQMADALNSGTVDAAWMIEPYITRVQTSIGAKIVTDTARGPTVDFPMSGYASTKKFAEENPETLKVFRSVLQQAQQLASTDKISVQDSLREYMDLDQQTAALVSVGTFPLSLSPVRLQRVADMMQDEKVLPNRLDVQSLIPPGTRS
jgi:NitT/TauT family transport system substrate-binding protein